MTLDEIISIVNNLPEGTSMNECSTQAGLITTLTSQQEQIKTLQDTVTKSTKELADEKTYHKNTRDAKEGLGKQIEEIHTFLSCLDVPPPEKTSNEQEYYRKELSVLTRIAIYFSNKAKI